jgi:hypothetical protein
MRQKEMKKSIPLGTARILTLPLGAPVSDPARCWAMAIPAGSETGAPKRQKGRGQCPDAPLGNSSKTCGFSFFRFPLDSGKDQRHVYVMKLPRFSPAAFSLLLVCGSLVQLRAADDTNSAPTAEKQIDVKADRLLKPLKLDDAAKAARVKSILGDWLGTLAGWHKENDPKIKALWSQWSKARSVVPKDEFPGEVVAHQIFDAYSSLQPTYQSFTNKLSGELTPEQIDTFKENWSRSPGMMRTYNAYLEIAPGLTDDQKKVIYDRMYRAREEAMLTDSDKEIINIFKCQKVKVEQYIGSLEWEKLHKAFANKGKADSPEAK